MLDNLPPCLTRRDDGEIVITGRGVNLYATLRVYKRDRTVEAVADYYDIPVEQVAPVIRFYHDRQAEVDAYFDDYKATLDRQYEEWKNSDMGRRHVSADELRRRWAEKKLGPLPSVNLGSEFDRPL